MAILKGGAWVELLKPGLRWTWFTGMMYRPRRRYERIKKYEAERTAAYEVWKTTPGS